MEQNVALLCLFSQQMSVDRCLLMVRHRAVCRKCGRKMRIAPSFVALTLLLKRQVSVPVLCLLSHLWDRQGSQSIILFFRYLL